MAHSDDHELDRVIVTATWRRCDRCGLPIDPEQHPHRFRHPECPAKPLPAEAVEALDRLRARAAHLEHQGDALDHADAVRAYEREGGES